MLLQVASWPCDCNLIIARTGKLVDSLAVRDGKTNKWWCHQTEMCSMQDMKLIGQGPTCWSSAVCIDRTWSLHMLLRCPKVMSRLMAATAWRECMCYSDDVLLKNLLVVSSLFPQDRCWGTARLHFVFASGVETAHLPKRVAQHEQADWSRR